MEPMWTLCGLYVEPLPQFSGLHVDSMWTCGLYVEVHMSSELDSRCSPSGVQVDLQSTRIPHSQCGLHLSPGSQCGMIS